MRTVGRISRDVQVNERCTGAITHAADVEPAPFQLHRRHVVQVFAGAAGRIAQLEADARAEIAELALTGLGIRLRHQVEQAKIVQFQRHGTARTAANAQGFTNGAAGLARLQMATVQWPGAQLQPGATVAEIGLVDGIATIDQRMVDADGRFQRLLAKLLLVVNQYLTDKGLGLTGVVVGNLKILQLNGKGQFLQQEPIAHAQEDEVGGAAFGQHDVATKGRHRARRQAAFGWNPSGGQIAGFDPQLTAPFLELQPQIAIEQAADTNHHHRDMGEQVAKAAVAALHRREHLMIVTSPQPPAIAARSQQAGQLSAHLLRLASGQMPLGLLVKAVQRTQLHPGAKPGHVTPQQRRLPVNAYAGREDQKSQDADEPACTIDVVQAEAAKNLEPERTELEHIIRIGLVLLQHGADHRGNGHHHQQGDGEVHRTEEFQQHPGEGTPGNRLACGVIVHGGALARVADACSTG